MPFYAQDTVLRVPRADDDRALMMRLGKQVMGILKEADGLPSAQRDAHVRSRLDEIDGGLSPFGGEQAETLALASGK